MSSKTDPGTIKNWLQVLVVAIASIEGIIVYALSQTPPNDPKFIGYVVMLIVFLLIIVVGLFVLQNQKVSAVVPSIETAAVKDGRPDNLVAAKVLEIKPTGDVANYFIDSNLDFMLLKPLSRDAVAPQYLSFAELLNKMGIGTAEGIRRAMKGLEMIPFGKSVASARNILFQLGNDRRIDFVAETTTPVVEEYLSRAQRILKEESPDDYVEPDTATISEVRARLNGTSNFDHLNFYAGLCLTILEKKIILQDPVIDTLGNVFNFFSTINKEPINQLAAGPTSVLWSTTNQIVNASIDGDLKDFSIYRYYGLYQNQLYYYLLSIQWSPESHRSIEIWDELKRMFESFRIVSKDGSAGSPAIPG